jgi:hypothetical protein
MKGEKINKVEEVNTRREGNEIKLMSYIST